MEGTEGQCRSPGSITMDDGDGSPTCKTHITKNWGEGKFVGGTVEQSTILQLSCNLGGVDPGATNQSGNGTGHGGCQHHHPRPAIGVTISERGTNGPGPS